MSLDDLKGKKQKPKNPIIDSDDDDAADYSGFVEVNGKKGFFIPGQFTTCIKTPSGLFVPSFIEDSVRQEMGLEECFITFAREITEQDFQADVEYRTNKNKPDALPSSVENEINDLIGRVEKGNLNVYKPQTPDVPKTKEGRDLKELGLPEDLFDDDGLFDG